MHRWLHRECGGEWWELHGVHGGDVQECHGHRGVFKLPEQCGICRRKHALRMSSWIHGGRGERRELHGVRGGDVQASHGLCGVLFVPCGQVCADGRQC